MAAYDERAGRVPEHAVQAGGVGRIGFDEVGQQTDDSVSRTDLVGGDVAHSLENRPRAVIHAFERRGQALDDLQARGLRGALLGNRRTRLGRSFGIVRSLGAACLRRLQGLGAIAPFFLEPGGQGVELA